MAQEEKMSNISESESRSTPIELQLELSRVLARVLSACHSPRTLRELRRSLGIEQLSLSRFVAFMDIHNFLERSSAEDTATFKQTEQGARLLRTFVALYRSASDHALPRSTDKRSVAHYAPCFNCARHALYPETPPMTLQVEGICELCHSPCT